MISQKSLAAAALLCLISVAASAQTAVCDQPKPRAALHLSAVREAAIDVRRVLCISGEQREEVLAAFVAFVEKQRASQWFAPYGGFENGADPLRDAEALLNAVPPQLAVAGVSPVTDALLIDGRPYQPASPAACRMAADGRACAEVLDEFADFYNHAQATYASPEAMAYAREVGELGRQWARFLENSRSQTPLELLVNGAAFRRNESLAFSAPPERQWIVLHPSLVVENVDDALDGQNTQEALMVEVLGVNWWRREKAYFPSGGSLITVYSDRTGIDDAGWGVALHFRGIYSVGLTRHDDSEGVFLSFDLLKLIQNKENVVRRLRP